MMEMSQKRRITGDLESLDEFYQRDKITDFVIFYLQREMHLGAGMERPSYLSDYFLDLERLRMYADQDRHHEISDEEVAALHLSPKDLETLFKGSQDDHRENKWADTCQWILDLLDEGYERTMEVLNQELVVVVVNGPDREYPDYRDPVWVVTHEERLNILFSKVNLTEYEGKTVQLKGYLTYVQNPPVERTIKANWVCTKCGGETESDWRKPDYCAHCSTDGKWEIVEDSIVKEKIQEALLTENYEESSNGFQTSLTVIFSKECTSKFAPGDHVSVIGVVMGKEVRIRGKDPYWNYVIEASQVTKHERVINVNDKDRKEIIEFAGKPDIMDRLAEKFAAGIIGHEPEKKAMLLQAFSANDIMKNGRRTRGNIHILFCGDPGTGKSQLLLASRQLNSKALYVSDASAAGLTAAVDEVNGKRVMVAGVMVLADQGIAAIDEIEKMNKDDRKAIHPAMEQGEIHKSKAGLHASFKSRTSVLAAANPKYGRFDDRDPVIQQIELEPSLLDRFDLIFIFKERPGTDNYEVNRAMLILEGGDGQDQEDFLAKYIAYSKAVNPEIPKDMQKKIAEAFVKLKGANKGYISTRTLEALQRLSLASARSRLQDSVDDQDVDLAVELMNTYLAQFSFDMDAISGITDSVRDCIYLAKSLISPDTPILETEVMAECQNAGFSESHVRKSIDELQRTGEIFSPRNGKLRRVA